MAATARPRPRLDELPEELVSNIVLKLDSDSSFAFRLTCRALEHGSLHEWASEYFSSKAIIPSSASLKVLASIAESEKLRDYLHHLYIIPAKFAPQSTKCCHGKSITSNHTVRQEEALKSYVADQKDLKRDGKLRERLVHVFRHLPALHGIALTDSVSRFPTEVNIHGLNSYIRKTNNALTILPTTPSDKEYYAWKSYVWKSTIQAIGLSGISTLKVLSTGLDNVKNSLVLSELNFNASTLHQLAKALRSIESLKLQISTCSNHSPDAIEEFDKTKAVKVSKEIASLMPSISSLDLTFNYSDDSATLFRNFLTNMTLSKLTTVRLDGASIDSKFLGTFTLGLVNVESLFLEWICLTKGRWPTILEAMLKLKKLNHLHLNYLSVTSGAACFLKEAEPVETARDDAQDGWGMLSPFSLNGGGAGAGTTAGAANHPWDIQGSSSSEFVTDEEDVDGEDDEDEYDSDEADDDDSMPDLEPQTGAAPAQPAQLPPSLTQVLSSLYPDSDAETDDSMPDLEPQTGDAPSQPAAQPPAPQATAAAANTAQNGEEEHNPYLPSSTNQAAQAPPDPESPDSRFGRGTERGRVICLNSSKEIQELLPRFIKEYHIVDADDDMDNDGMFGPPIVLPVGAGAGAGAAPLPTFNTFMNHLHATFVGPGTNNGNGGGFGNNGALQGLGAPQAPIPFGGGLSYAPASTNAGTAGGGSEEEWTDEDY